MSEPREPEPVPVPAPRNAIPLHCPLCSTRVQVLFKRQYAKCTHCGLEWKWKSTPKEVSL